MEAKRALQWYDSVKHKMIRLRIMRIHTEISISHKLEAVICFLHRQNSVPHKHLFIIVSEFGFRFNDPSSLLYTPFSSRLSSHKGALPLSVHTPPTQWIVPFTFLPVKPLPALFPDHKYNVLLLSYRFHLYKTLTFTKYACIDGTSFPGINEIFFGGSSIKSSLSI